MASPVEDGYPPPPDFWESRHTTVANSRTTRAISKPTSSVRKTTQVGSPSISTGYPKPSTAGTGAHRTSRPSGTESSSRQTLHSIYTLQTSSSTLAGPNASATPSKGTVNGSSTLSPGANSTSFSRLGSNNARLTPAAMRGVIAGSVIGSVLVVALIAWLCLRKRKRPTSVDELLIRPPSSRTFLTAGTKDATLTALPLYRKRERSEPEMALATPQLPSRVFERLSAHQATMADLWKTANPPTPASGTFPHRTPLETSSPLSRRPEMAMAAPASLLRPTIHVTSHGDDFHTPAGSIRAPSTYDPETSSRLGTPLDAPSFDDNRGSWTTSYATARSHTDSRSLGSTISSLPGFRSARQWLQARSPLSRGWSNVQDDEAGVSPNISGRFFKNKATKPNLAPVPTREMSQRTSDTGAKGG